jgi:hypothetical protein
MKIALEALPGKRITSVFFGEDRPGPGMRVFLCFADGESFEFFGKSFDWSILLQDAKTRVIGYVTSGQGEVFHGYPNPDDPDDSAQMTEAPCSNEPHLRSAETAPHETPIFETQEEMEAWEEVKAAVAKAKCT